jgi:hypothetical protein
MNIPTIIIQQSSDNLAVWVGILGVFVGFIGSVVVELIRGNITTKQKKADLKAQQNRVQNLNQLEILKELQDKCSDLLRGYFRLLHEDIMNSKKKIKWREGLVDNDLSEHIGFLQRRIIILSSRVYDDTARKRSKKFTDSLLNYNKTTDETDARLLLNNAISVFENDLNKVIGKLIRNLHIDKSKLP